PSPNDFARESMRAMLVPVLVEDRSERVLVERIEDIGRRGCIGTRTPVHSHVEWRVLAEGETAARIIDLMRGNPEIEQHAIEMLAHKRTDLINVREVAKIRREAT